MKVVSQLETKTISVPYLFIETGSFSCFKKMRNKHNWGTWNKFEISSWCHCYMWERSFKYLLMMINAFVANFPLLLLCYIIVITLPVCVISLQYPVNESSSFLCLLFFGSSVIETTISTIKLILPYFEQAWSSWKHSRS